MFDLCVNSLSVISHSQSYKVLCAGPSNLRRATELTLHNHALLKTGAGMVCKTKERAGDPLLVPALAPLAMRSIC